MQRETTRFDCARALHAGGAAGRHASECGRDRQEAMGMGVLRRVTALCLVVALDAQGAAQAQSEAGQSRLILGVDKGAKGDEVFIPLMLSPAAGAKISKISATVGFPAEALQFVSAKQGAPPEFGLELHSELTPGVPDST